jgi:type VI secretion system protein ImpH
MTDTNGDVPATLADRLLKQGYGFDFFQAVRMLEKMAPDRRPVGLEGPPAAEVARFRAHLGLSFPASAIYQVEPPAEPAAASIVTVTFMGLTGPSGVLPRHYTELLMRARDNKGPERFVARDWFDLFNHRLISLFYRAWTKYRFWLTYERGEYKELDPDLFTESLYCLIGLGGRSLKNRLRIAVMPPEGQERVRVLARVDDLVLLYYAGLFAHRPRNAVSLERLLQDYFRTPLRVLEFQGQWLQLDRANQSQLGTLGGNNELGVNVVVGERVWDIRSKIRIRIGPVNLERFSSFLPDRSPVPARKEFFKLMHLVRLYVGPELMVDVQLVLEAKAIPACQMVPSGNPGPRLGWNCWLTSQPARRDSEDAVFTGTDVSWVPDTTAA